MRKSSAKQEEKPAISVHLDPIERADCCEHCCNLIDSGSQVKNKDIFLCKTCAEKLQRTGSLITMKAGWMEVGK